MADDTVERMARIEERTTSIQSGVDRIERRLTHEFVPRAEIRDMERRIGNLEKAAYAGLSFIVLGVLGAVLRVVLAQ